MTLHRMLIVVAALVPQPALADALQQQLLAGARAANARDFAFTQTFRFERTGTAATERLSRYDPRNTARPWTLLSVDGKPATARQVDQDSRRASRVPPPSYARIADWIGAPATRIAATPTRVTYRFARLPAGAFKMGSFDASANTSAEAVVNTAGKTPYVERVRFTSIAPFRMFLVARIERFGATSVYRVLPDGRPVPASVTTEFSGSMMGKAGTMTTRATYTDFVAAR